MKCLIINGSPSKRYNWGGKIVEGFTGQLVDEVRRSMAALGEVGFEEIRLADADLSYCKGCYNCFFGGEDKCPHAGVMQPILEKLDGADCLILSSPVYALDVSGLVKTFFDLTAFNFHRPRYFTKKALVVSSTAGAAAKKTCAYMRDTLMHWGFNRVYMLPVVRMSAAEPSKKMKKRCADAAERLYFDTKSGKAHSPNVKRVFFFQLWKAMGLSTPENADGRYWLESGLARHAYSPDVPLGLPKRVFGKLIGGMLCRVMK